MWDWALRRLLLSLVYSVVNLVVDLLYTAIDPSLKTMFATKGRRAARKEMRRLLEEEKANG